MKREMAMIVVVGIVMFEVHPQALESAQFPNAEKTAIRKSPGCNATPPSAPGDTATFSMKVGDLEREYRLHLPRDYDAGSPVSLVLDFHGYTGTAKQEEIETTGLSRHADEHGYVIVYPQATAFAIETGDKITSWNDLTCNASSGPEGPICSETAYEYPHPPECGEPRRCIWCTCHDDLGFITQLLDHLEDILCVDLGRIYATGMSNGGMFVHRLGCNMPERFAAIAPVSGTLAKGFNCAPERSTPLSLMNIYGSRDRYVSLDGTMSSDGYYYTSAEDVMRKWAARDSQNCDATPTRYATSEDGILSLECTQQENCSTGAEVANCTWDGAHDWPKGEGRDFGNQIIWEFFARHSRAGYQSTDKSR